MDHRQGTLFYPCAKRSLCRISSGLLLAWLLFGRLAWAQASAEVAAPSTVPQPPAARPAPPPPQPAPAAATTPAPAVSLLSAQVGTRLAVRVQDPYDRNKLNDFSSEGEAFVSFSGQAHPFVRWQAAFHGSYGDPGGSSEATLRHLLGKLELSPALNLWVGRMRIPGDRSTLATRWEHGVWTLPGRYGHLPVPPGGPLPPVGLRLPGQNERGDGGALWGQLGGGRFKYYVGAFGLDRPITSPLVSARLNLALLEPEPGYDQPSTYYGSKDILSIGLAAQRQVDGSEAPLGSEGPTSDYNAATLDVLFEKNGGAAGVLGVEVAATKIWGDYEPASYQAHALLSYLVPLDIGIGRFQPLVRAQHAGKGPAEGSGDITSVDAQLGYIVDGSRTRLLALYQYLRLPGQTQNVVLIGLQLMSAAR